MPVAKSAETLPQCSQSTTVSWKLTNSNVTPTVALFSGKIAGKCCERFVNERCDQPHVSIPFSTRHSHFTKPHHPLHMLPHFIIRHGQTHPQYRLSFNQHESLYHPGRRVPYLPYYSNASRKAGSTNSNHKWARFLGRQFITSIAPMYSRKFALVIILHIRIYRQ